MIPLQELWEQELVSISVTLQVSLLWDLNDAGNKAVTTHVITPLLSYLDLVAKVAIIMHTLKCMYLLQQNTKESGHNFIYQHRATFAF